MKYVWLVLILYSKISYSQLQTCENIFIITTDGYRWQELFNGADSGILFNPRYVTDTTTLKYLYWDTNPKERRKKLMPFVWNFIAAKGQLWGNRNFENKISVANPYRFSYAGYNEILTGYADRSVITNKARENSNGNLLEFLNSQREYKDKVAVFGSWKLFSYILNKRKTNLSLNCGYQQVEDDSLSIAEEAVNYLQQNSERNSEPTRSDILTFSLATEFINKNHPRILYIGFGETDEFAHHGQYDRYLGQANMFDKMLSELWALIQHDEFYKNKTSIFITTDHGRGRSANKWTTHGPFTKGSDETWLMQLGPNIASLGEVKTDVQFDNEQFAQTIAGYLGKEFTSNHPVAGPVSFFNPLPATFNHLVTQW